MNNDVEMANDEGASPSGDLQKPKEQAQPAADAIDKDDPHKVEKLAKMGHADEEASKGTE